MRKTTIKHLSNGIVETGGFRHEQFLMHELAACYQSRNLQAETITLRYNRFYRGLHNFVLMGLGIKAADADINIVPGRLALSALARNIFSSRKILIVLHYFDERDSKGFLLKWYYRFLFSLLRNIRFTNTAVVAVSSFWQKYFTEKLRAGIPVFLFPNFFDPEIYRPFVKGEKLKQIHLGQYSAKNDKGIYSLASKLSDAGYQCYFSTLVKQEAASHDAYEVRYGSFEDYLDHMSSSLYTIAWPAFNEGWNRVAHESILLGTPVIGADAGGLGDLIRESGSMQASTTEEFMHCIVGGDPIPESNGFIEKYDAGKASDYLLPVFRFLQDKGGN